MEVVIYIPDEIYDVVCECEKNLQRYCMDVTGGTPLPKRHGRLIDADALLSKAKFLYKGYEIALTNTIGDAPTIIEADEDEE